MPIETLKVKTARRTQLVNVTSQVQQAVEKSRVTDGVCIVYVPHTTAAVTINEGADPDVASDLEGAFDRLIPFEGPYRHEEGNSDSHMKSVLTGASQAVFVAGGQLQLGRWQGTFFREFDGPLRAAAAREGRSRPVLISGCGELRAMRCCVRVFGANDQPRHLPPGSFLPDQMHLL
jgi:secondary thiamine-phosphate synthase enzyme